MRTLCTHSAFLLVFLAMGGVLLPASALRAEDQEDKFDEFQEDLDDFDTGLKVLTGGAFLQALRKPGSAWPKVASELNRVRTRVSKAKTVVDKLGKIKDELEAQKLAQDFSREYKDLDDEGSGYRGELEKLRDAILELEVGLVGEESDSRKFKVTLELLIDDEDEAISRFVAMGKAMQDNIDAMEARKEVLEEIADRGKRASKGLNILAESLAEIHQYGGSVFGDFLLLEALDCFSFAKLCSSVAGDARRKAALIDRVIAQEERRLDNLKSNLKEFWGVRL